MQKFPENVGVMRHADDLTGRVSPRDRERIQNIAEGLRMSVGVTTPIDVYHSPLKRAQMTADTLVAALLSCGMQSVRLHGPLSWLNCEEYTITVNNLRSVQQDGRFAVCVSHQPDIERFIEPYYKTGVGYCYFFTKEFSIP